MSIDIRIRDGLCPDPSTGEGGATEGDIRGSFSDIIDTVGVKDLSGGHALVTQNSPAAMSVLVAPGVVYIPNADYDELDSNQVKFWEAVITVSTAVAITANTSGSTRIDLICVKMDTTVTPDEHASNIATLVAVAGTPGAGVPATPDNYAKLAEVSVANGAATIVTADITDSRVQSKFSGKYLGMTTKGDLIVASADDTPTRLAVGSDGYVPRANSGATNGIEWTPPYNSLAYNCIINGGFTVNQRVYVSNATLAAGAYGHDRWKAGASGGDYTFTQLAQATTITIKTGKSLIQVIEDKNVIGGTYTLSWTGTAQARFGINSATPSGAYAASPITITTQTAGTVMSVEFNEGTLGQVNLANSSVALPFMPKSFEEELRACQRYYELVGLAYAGGCPSGSNAVASAQFTVTKRIAPTTVVQITDGYFFAGDGVATTTSTYIAKIDGIVAYRASNSASQVQFSELVKVDTEL